MHSTVQPLPSTATWPTLVTLTLALLAPRAEAGFVTPDFRGAPDTTWFGWDVFEETPGKDFPLNWYLLDDTPDIGINPGGALVKQNNDVPFEDWGNISLSNNLYSGPWGPFDLSVFVPTTADGTTAQKTRVVFQLRENGGTPLNPFLLNGRLADISSVAEIDDRLHHYAEWHLFADHGLHEISITSVGAHAAIDAFVIDTVVTPVPLPGAATLLLSALVGGWTTLWRRALRLA